MKRIKILASILILILVLGFAFNWVRTHGYIEVTVENNEGSSLNFSLINKESREETKFSSKDKSVKKLIKTGEYEVYVQSETSSFITSISTKGFLANTNYSDSLRQEDAREFVGYNPNPCSSYLGDRLFSHECTGSLSSVLTHVPASANQPTYTAPTGISDTTPIVGTAQTKLGKVILTEAVFKTEEELINDYSVGLLGEGFTIQNRRFINQLPLNKEYGISAFRDGFLIYNIDLSEAYYYASIAAEPEMIVLPKSNSTDMRPVSLTAQNDTLVLLFTNATIGDEPDEDASPESEVILYQDKLTQRYKFKETISSAALCGKKLCAINNSVLSFYVLKGKELIADNQMVGVQAMYTIGESLYYLSKRGVFVIDSSTYKGNFSYSLGKYLECGLTPDGQGYLMCLIDGKQNKVALKVTPGIGAEIAIDKRVLELQSNPNIIDTSIYKNILYVTPDLDPTKTESEAQQLGYTEKQIAEGQKLLNNAVTKSKLPTESLTIINTTAPFSRPAQ